MLISQCRNPTVELVPESTAFETPLESLCEKIDASCDKEHTQIQ